MRAFLWVVACGASLSLVALAPGRGEAGDWARSGWYRNPYGPGYNFIPNNYYGGYSYSIPPVYPNVYPIPGYYGYYGAGYGNNYFAPSPVVYPQGGYSSSYYVPGYGLYQAPDYSTYYSSGYYSGY
jgi:hypothetical protein